uniref:Uncharacterized protein n=1 Tax=Anguilla anguilla TaxID=7936 RepID=A0A0E9XKR5_ANGAN
MQNIYKHNRKYFSAVFTRVSHNREGNCIQTHYLIIKYISSGSQPCAPYYTPAWTCIEQG